MEWTRSRGLRTHAGKVKKSFLGGPECLEVRHLLSATQPDGMDAASWSPTLSELSGAPATQIEWNGLNTTAQVDHWNGRLADCSLPLGATVALSLGAANWRAVSLGNGYFSLTTPGTGRSEVLAWAARTPGILAFEPDFVLQSQAVSNDPGVTSQWGLNNLAIDNYGLIGSDIDAMRAWDISTGSRNVVVAVIDSGIDLTHPDLAANIWTNPGEIAGNGVDDDRNGFVDDIHGWNFVDNSANVQDGYGHGTHVAGIIGAVGNNGIGVTGINWSVSIMPLKFQDDFGVGYTGEAIAALNYATMMRRDHGINVVVTNNSWGGGTGVSAMLQEAIRAHGEAGITFVAAAGNSGVDCDVSPRYPACFDLPNVISVAATDRYDNLVTFSNYGATTVDLGAPGVGIYSTRPNGSYGSMSGSSQAAPQVSGVVALLAAVKPDITVAQIRAAIFGSVDRVAGLAGKTATGGRINAAAALASLSGQPTTSDAAVTVVNSLPIGAIETANAVAVRGWAFDQNAGSPPITVQLWVDGSLVGTVLAASPRDDLVPTCGSPNHGYVMTMPPLPIGNHTVEVRAFDQETGLFVSLGQRIVAVRPPVGTVEIATPRRLTGWAFSSRAEDAPIRVRVVINGRVYGGFLASVPRPDLSPRFSSINHGFDILLNPAVFRRGRNTVQVYAIDPLSKLPTLIGTRIVRR